jgi:mono/diheme cytochrome c family protein
MRRAALVALALTALTLSAVACGGEKNRTTEPVTVIGTIETGAAQTGATETGATQTGGATTGGGAAEGDPTAGKQVFSSAGCASCHTLADAGATGTVGPNLDDAKPAYDLVIDRVTHGKGAMPAFGDQGLLNDTQIKDVAAYVVKATSG